LLDSLDSPGAQMVLPKNQVSIRGLGALTAATGDEFALFTLRGERLLVRGDSSGILLSESELGGSLDKRYRFSGHSHPRVNGTGDMLSINSSGGDRGVLRDIFKQPRSVIIDSGGNRNVFTPMPGSDTLIYPRR